MTRRLDYPLAALQSHRERLLAEVRRAFGLALAEQARALALAEEGERAHRDALRLRRAAAEAAPGATAGEVEAHGRWVAGLRRSEDRLQEEAARRRAEAGLVAARAEQARSCVVDAERALRCVERHRERWEEERRRSLEEARDAEADDVAAGGRAQRRT